MLTKTTISAIRALTYVGLYGGNNPMSPRQLAEALHESPSYLAKVVRHLVRVGILRAHRGVAGGVTLDRAPEDVTLLAVVEACQGTILAAFCEDARTLTKTCAFHQAAAELHRAVVNVLARWTLADLLRNPSPSRSLKKTVQCVLEPCDAVKVNSAARVERRVRGRSGVE